MVAESSNLAFEEGDEVIVTGFDLGMNTSGGFAGYIRVPASWVLRLPGNNLERKYGLRHRRFYRRALRLKLQAQLTKIPGRCW